MNMVSQIVLDGNFILLAFEKISKYWEIVREEELFKVESKLKSLGVVDLIIDYPTNANRSS